MSQVADNRQPGPAQALAGHADHFPVFNYDQSRYLTRKKLARAVVLRGFFFHTFLRV